MEPSDNIEEKFRKSFSDYAPDPPGRIWEEIRNDLYPAPRAEGFWSRIFDFTKISPKWVYTYTTVAISTVILFLAVVYLVAHDHHTIRGHAYVGESRLCGGTAILFKVEDKAAPLDSVDYYRTVIIDKNGYFQFPRVESGRYLLRVSPQTSSETAEKFMPSWFDQHSNPEQSDLIIITSEDLNTDVHLAPNQEIRK